jgi:hypothetical protein
LGHLPEIAIVCGRRDHLNDAANVIDREAARGWGAAASAPTNDAWQVDWRKCDACYVGLEPFNHFVCRC